ncbi:MAG: cytochrome P450 [Planctomycetota bacterium]
MATPSLDTLDIISPDHYQQHGYPHEEWALLRREAPIYWYTRTPGVPFWAVTKYQDIITISKQPRRLLNSPRLGAFPEAEERAGGISPQDVGRHLLIMDPPTHGKYRHLVSERFTPGAMRGLRAKIEELTTEILDGVSTEGDMAEIDFVTEVSSVLPLAVIAHMLGVPRSDWKLLFQWTNQMIGSGDPEYCEEGETPEESGERARLEAITYFAQMVEERKKSPQDDLVSILTHAEVDGGPLPVENLFAFFNLIVIAGNETTRNATSGGLLALIENPGEFEKLRRDPSLVPRAVEEILRWTTPVIQFCRTATEDVEIRGQKIRTGESLCLFYPSANRDEDIFEEPFRFKVDRDPNPHLAFGIGEHFCLGSHVARLELNVMFQQLVARLDEVELAWPVERLRSPFLGGVKHMPVRYRLR